LDVDWWWFVTQLQGGEAQGKKHDPHEGIPRGFDIVRLIKTIRRTIASVGQTITAQDYQRLTATEAQRSEANDF